jgi:hypothetical protein
VPELKSLTPEGVPAALAKAYRYRLLNEPEQAESICHDVLRIDPEAGATGVVSRENTGVGEGFFTKLKVSFKYEGE